MLDFDIEDSLDIRLVLFDELDWLNFVLRQRADGFRLVAFHIRSTLGLITLIAMSVVGSEIFIGLDRSGEDLILRSGDLESLDWIKMDALYLAR